MTHRELVLFGRVPGTVTAIAESFATFGQYGGVLHRASLVDSTPAQIAEQINTNLLDTAYALRAAVPYLQETRGSFVAIGSSNHKHGRAYTTSYSASKAGVVGLVQGVAEELATRVLPVDGAQDRHKHGRN